MKIFITSTNTDVGKTYFTVKLFKRLVKEGYHTVIYKPFQTEMLEDGTFPDLEAYRQECQLDYDTTSLYTFKNPVSPHLAFKQEQDQHFNISKVLEKLRQLENAYDIVLIEGAGGIGVPIYEGDQDFYMTADLIDETSDKFISVLPSKLGAINDIYMHQSFINMHHLPQNILVMNRYDGSEVEQDNLSTSQKLVNQDIFTFKTNGTDSDISKPLLQEILGGNYE
ncbi:dethiobiotin synthase [Staphylococcus massiliensis]|uniref:ATP-dependent dethiobiotin synthetase BioD n=1 Tax=Staphylococcus massiliensis S46 TaxID=1229783 RepID=K9B095_9STAP|nr:dethiobiotin synthase [Staphylococcus massiliensis]EKU48232.1 dethiobiotin synthetase [Staphylococcus massiliensis S46]MCG3399507.1 dethiobiotin synthase [Staphylococcus massiliensis]MCG3402016.1 dethiobiotin synthase [Staphylococcus massiliensis]MCG3412755.1 dethiobiotin synthase [Staphylococcus massiliensis]POA00116.1 dethiobiotin synthase [Staphylococcus massiliensis CCUG 55927]